MPWSADLLSPKMQSCSSHENLDCNTIWESGKTISIVSSMTVCTLTAAAVYHLTKLFLHFKWLIIKLLCNGLHAHA